MHEIQSVVIPPLCSPCNNSHKLRAADTNVDRSHGKIQTMIQQWVGTSSTVRSAFDSWWQNVQAEGNFDSDRSRICSTRWTCFILQVSTMMPIVYYTCNNSIWVSGIVIHWKDQFWVIAHNVSWSWPILFSGLSYNANLQQFVYKLSNIAFLVLDIS